MSIGSIPLIDSHLDLSYSALSFDRNLAEPIDRIRQREQGMTDSGSRGNATISFEEMRRGNMGLCLATVLARAIPVEPKGKALQSTSALSVCQQITELPREGMPRTGLDFANQDIAYAIGQGQLAYYRLMEQKGHMRMIRSRAQLDAHWQAWLNDQANTPLGYILSMEGADPIVTPDQVDQWWADGLRAVGPVHYGHSAYAVGTGFDGSVTPAGHELLKAFERVGMIVDITHLSDTSFYETLDAFGGRVMASHHNCRALVPADRQLTDEQIKKLIERDAVIGSAYDAWMLYPGWEIGKTSSEVVGMDAVADHIDHICQLAGNTRHVAIGSDLDGGFGKEQSVRDLDTIADIQKLGPILKDRGYSDEDIAGIFHGNWLRFFREALPAN